MPRQVQCVDALWQALCPSFYRLPSVNLRRVPKRTGFLAQRSFRNQAHRDSTRPKYEDTRNQLQTENDCDRSGNGREFFFSGHHVELDAAGRAIAPARWANNSQDESGGDMRHSSRAKSSQDTKSSGKSSLGLYQGTDRKNFGEDDGRLATYGKSQEGQNPTFQPLNLESEPRSFKARQWQIQKELNSGELHEELQRTSIAGDYPRTRESLRELVQDRGERPGRTHYQALLLANTSPQHGSAAEVHRILLEMEEAGITLDSAAYHAVLRVLSVHPDYLLRRQILEELRQRWFTLSSDGWHELIVGLLRDKQIESAVAVLQSAQQVDILIAPWLYDVLIYNLCDVGEFDEVLSILQFRVNSGDQRISGTVWYYFLDTASSALHYHATLYAWRKRVEPNYLNPPSGMCLNVLNTAARHGDFLLATDVIRILGNRNQTLQIYHYEALVESYLPTDLHTALMILTLMTTTGVPPTESSTRVLAVHLRQRPHLAQTALSILGELREQDWPIPVEAVNLVIESYVDHGKSDIALETYKTLHTLCPSGPVTRTFNTLLRGCRGRKETAMFLASEMVALKVLPDEVTYDRLILVCMEASPVGGMDDAWCYFSEMREAGWWPPPGTAMAMARRCCQDGDERILRLQSDGQGGHGIERPVLQRLVDAGWRKGEEGMKSSKLLELMDADDPWA
ncbi:MAG: hypothetical protein LQ348_001287 [Seirophora lacunosa]|nr:MAG: hypothetical protein LQ348_001287 [Seirophora lacunosa]